MRYKVMWLSSLITMTLWLGNITGCSTPPVVENDQASAAAQNEAQTQAALEAWAKNWKPPTEEMPVEATTAAMPPVTEVTSTQPVTEGMPTDEVTPVENDTTPARCGPMAAGDVCATCQGEKACSMHQPAGQPILTPTMNRGHWPKIVVKTEAGQTRHWPVYFNDCPVYPAEADPGSAPGTEASIHAALANDRAAGASFENMQAVPTQPIKAAFDLVTLPVRAIVNPPMVTNTSP